MNEDMDRFSKGLEEPDHKRDTKARKNSSNSDFFIPRYLLCNNFTAVRLRVGASKHTHVGILIQDNRTL